MVPSVVQRQIRIFVQLGYGFGASSWSARWEAGLIPGLNERLPYGYFHAASPDCTIEYSEDQNESRPVRLVRRTLRRLAGFDLLHVWRNRRGIFGADAIWTHTELENLAVLLLLRHLPRARRPPIVAQCVWLFDRWESFSAPRRRLYRSLLEQADVIAVLSPDNLALACQIFPRMRCELMLYGNDISRMIAPTLCAAHRPLRIVALGNDMHRDWRTLIAAVGPMRECELVIASTQIAPQLAAGLRHIRVERPSSASEIAALYAWADIAVVPLKPNLHASGVTAIAEAVLSGVAVVCTDTGGLHAYYSEDDLSYVPPGDAAAMGSAIGTLGADDDLRFQMVTRAQRRMIDAGLSSRDHALRLRELTFALLRDRAAEATSAADRSAAAGMRTTG
jgi:glycosyltransferase involved in cell wall biosynthesis